MNWSYSYKVGIIFYMYQIIRSKGTYWDGPRQYHFSIINIQLRKLVYNITKSWRINITKNIFLVLSSDIYVFLFFPCINSSWLCQNLDILICPRNKHFLRIFWAKNHFSSRRLNGDVVVKSSSCFNMKFLLWFFVYLCCP